MGICNFISFIGTLDNITRLSQILANKDSESNFAICQYANYRNPLITKIGQTESCKEFYEK